MDIQWKSVGSKVKQYWQFPSGPVSWLRTFTAEGPDSIPGQGTKISPQKKKKKKKRKKESKEKKEKAK